MIKIHLSHEKVYALANSICEFINKTISLNKKEELVFVYPVVRGGVPVCYLLQLIADRKYSFNIEITKDIGKADYIVDDLVDTGWTRAAFKTQNNCPSKPFVALLTKHQQTEEWYSQNGGWACSKGWIVFPWENEECSKDDTLVGTAINVLRETNQSFKANDNISKQLRHGDLLLPEIERRVESLLDCLLIDWKNDPNMKGTPARAAKMYYKEIFKGRFQELPPMTTFPNTKGLDELVLTGPITVRSSCSHHLAPITGKAWIGYIPNEKVLGLSKFNRVVDHFASRPQIQEELTIQIADQLEHILEPKGLAIVMKLSHSCMTWRGVKEHSDSIMTTSSMRGVFLTKPEARAEFLKLI